MSSELQRLPLPRQAIVIDISDLQFLMREFCAEMNPDGESDPMDMQRRMHFNTFIAWLIKREKTKENSSGEKGQVNES